MAADLVIAVILGVIICGAACALVVVLFWMLWRRKDSTGSFYMAARRSTMLIDNDASERSWKNSSEPAINRYQSNSSEKETHASGSQTRTSSQNAHLRSTSLQSSNRPDVTPYAPRRQASDGRQNMEIADPSGILQPHELEACIPSELDGEALEPAHASPWTGRTLNSESNAPGFLRKLSLRTRRATKQSRDSGFFVPRPSALGMRRLDRSAVNAELEAVRASMEEEKRIINPSPATINISPMTSSSTRHDPHGDRTPLRASISHESMELDAESPTRRASLSSWRQSRVDSSWRQSRADSSWRQSRVDSTWRQSRPEVRAPPAAHPARNSSLGPEWFPRSSINARPDGLSRHPSELSGESILRRSSVWIERESFPPRLTQSLDIPRNSFQPWVRPVVVMNSPTESSAYDTTNDSKANSDDDDEDDEAEGEEDGSRNATASWALPPMTLYSPALSRDRFISPLISPAVFSNADSSPASTPRLNGISPLPSPFLQSNNSRTSPLPSPYLPAKKQNLASAELLAPTTYMPPPPKGAKEPSSTVHYPSWSEISGFDFVKREKKAATATAMATAEEGDGEDGEGDDGQGDEEGEGQGDDGWKPVPDSAAGRYELAT